MKNTNSKSETVNKFPLKALIGFAIYLLLSPAILFISAGTLKWGMAWVYAGMSIIMAVVSRIVMIRKNPDLATERASYRQLEAKPWDRVLLPLVAIYGPMAIMIVAGLDKRFDWSPEISLPVTLVALIVAVLGFLFGTWALVENRFFSAVVRIQEDRGHTVCDTGPYRYVRHPGYASGILFFLATSFILGSLWSLIPTALAVIFTVVRTALEDKTLQAELGGYKEYAARVRYRLLPGVW